MMANKLGFKAFDIQRDVKLLEQLQHILTLTETDMTIFYRKLANLDATVDPDDLSDAEIMRPLLDAYYAPDELEDEVEQQAAGWLRQYMRRLQQDGLSNAKRRDLMNRTNPKYVLRNYLSQVAIDKAEAGDYSEILRLHELLKQPYDEQPEFETYAAKRPDWARSKAGCSMLSCSS